MAGGPWPEDWNSSQTSIEEVEEQYPAKDGRPAPGGLHEEWEALKAAVREGDEVWFYSSPQHYWQNLAGRMGVALVRDGKIVQNIDIVMN